MGFACIAWHVITVIHIMLMASMVVGPMICKWFLLLHPIVVISWLIFDNKCIISEIEEFFSETNYSLSKDICKKIVCNDFLYKYMHILLISHWLFFAYYYKKKSR